MFWFIHIIRKTFRFSKKAKIPQYHLSLQQAKLFWVDCGGLFSARQSSKLLRACPETSDLDFTQNFVRISCKGSLKTEIQNKNQLQASPSSGKNSANFFTNCLVFSKNKILFSFKKILQISSIAFLFGPAQQQYCYSSVCIVPQTNAKNKSLKVLSTDTRTAIVTVI